MNAGSTPVNVLTGFLGSGKTTLLQRLLRSEAFADTAVIVNEFGEIGLDHQLIQGVAEGVLLLQSGCICCTIRSDLQETIRDLLSKRERGVVPGFRRLVIETTGLADPAPILSTVLSEPVIRHHFRLGNVLCTVDAVNGPLHLDHHVESRKQAAVADRLIVTKTDLVSDGDAEALVARLIRLNPAAALLRSADERFDPALLLSHDLGDARYKAAEVARWLAASPGHHHDGHDVNRHGDGIRAFALTFEKPLDWTAFGVWLTMLLHSHGEAVLRVKGILAVAGVATPVVVHGVQHLVHPPVHLEAWPDADRRSRLVFIVDGLEPAAVRRSLAVFNRLAVPELEYGDAS